MKQPLRSTTETARISTGDPLPKQPGSLREIHYRNSQDLCGRSTTETNGIYLCVFAPLRLCVYFFQAAGISTGDPLPMQGSLREIHYLCVFASLRLFLLNSLTRGHHPHPPTPCSRQRGGAAFLSRC